MFKSLFLKYAIEYGLRGIGMGAAIIAGTLSTKYGVDGDTTASIQAGLVAAGGVLLDKGISWWQTQTMKVRADNQAAKIAIVAKETDVAIGPAKVEAAQIAYDKKEEIKLGKQ